MRTLPNTQLTENYTLYNFLETTLSRQATILNWKNIAQFEIQNAQVLAGFLETINRIIINDFRAKNKGRTIFLEIVSGFRCREWELLRGRSGKSQHTTGNAVDVQPRNCSPKLAVEVLNYLHSIHAPTATGHQGGFAQKPPTYQNGKIISLGFLHYDMRGRIARWTY